MIRILISCQPQSIFHVWHRPERFQILFLPAKGDSGAIFRYGGIVSGKLVRGKVFQIMSGKPIRFKWRNNTLAVLSKMKITPGLPVITTIAVICFPN